jgi:hypothetical protein
MGGFFWGAVGFAAGTVVGYQIHKGVVRAMAEKDKLASNLPGSRPPAPPTAGGSGVPIQD